MLLGLADEPERQRQPVAFVGPADRALLVLGGPGSGVSNVLEVVAAQAQGSGRSRSGAPGTPVGRRLGLCTTSCPPAGSVVLIDDLDAVALRLPPEYAHVVLERVEGLVRRAGDAGVLVVAGAHRMTGPVSRVAELFARRIVLPYPTRVDHAAAGGDPSAFDPAAPPGRGRLDGRAVQIAAAPAAPPLHAPVEEQWMPAARLTGVVARRSPAGRRALAVWREQGVRVLDVDDYVADPASAADGCVVIVGEPDDWQRHWRLLADVRGDHDLVIDTSCAAELRVVAGYRGRAAVLRARRGARLAHLGRSGARPHCPSLRRCPAEPSGRCVDRLFAQRLASLCGYNPDRSATA